MLTEHVVRVDGHTTFYLAAGPVDGPLIIFVHGWPELSLSWRHQLRALAALGFRAIAPDLRGYGRSSCYEQHDDYAQEHVVGDMIGLLGELTRDRSDKKAVWVGHDWGAPVVWNIASHHPERCHGVANLCVPYATLERGLDRCIELVDRSVYPEAEYPAGQWDYQLFYQESFDLARAGFEQNVQNTVQLLFRKGSADGRGKPAGTATTRQNGGWFGGGGAPAVPRDDDVVTEADVAAYVAALTHTGFFGADSFYMNHGLNAEYARTAVNDGKLDMPVLFLGAQYDYVCETFDSNLAEPMRELCSALTEHMIPSGHWMAQEQPVAVNSALVAWLARSIPYLWPDGFVEHPQPA